MTHMARGLCTAALRPAAPITRMASQGQRDGLPTMYRFIGRQDNPETVDRVLPVPGEVMILSYCSQQQSLLPLAELVMFRSVGHLAPARLFSAASMQPSRKAYMKPHAAVAMFHSEDLHDGGRTRSISGGFPTRCSLICSAAVCEFT